jgi:hypothetical protein
VERVHRTARHFHGGGVKASHQPLPAVGPEDHVTIHLTVIGIHELHRDDDAPSKARLSVLKVWVSGLAGPASGAIPSRLAVLVTTVTSTPNDFAI